MRSFLLVLTALLLPLPALAAAEIGKPAPDFTATDIEGKTVKLSDFKGKTVVLEWHNPECPFVKKHYDANNMQAAQAHAAGFGVVWLTVNSSAEGKQGHLTPEGAKDVIAAQKAAPTHYIVDAEGAIGRLYDAKTTPHMFIVDAGGTLVYAGAIDDRATTDPKDIEGARNYVTAALDNMAANQPVSISSTQAYGCGVKYKD